MKLIIYKIDFNDCLATYIGQTSEYLRTCICHHSYERKNKISSDNSSALMHRLDWNDNFKFAYASVITTETSKNEKFWNIRYEEIKNRISSH